MEYKYHHGDIANLLSKTVKPTLSRDRDEYEFIESFKDI